MQSRILSAGLPASRGRRPHDGVPSSVKCDEMKSRAEDWLPSVCGKGPAQ